MKKAIMQWCVILFFSMSPVIISYEATAAEQTLTLALLTDPTNIDPRLGVDVNSARVFQLVTNGLVQKDPQLQILPCLAERWENPDETTYIFYLRKDVRFHDGSEFTADDVKYTFESILNPELHSPFAHIFESIAAIEVLDAYRVKFVLHAPFAAFLDAMVQPIVPKHKAGVMDNTRFAEMLIGTGPFKLIEWRHDESLVFSANPDYFEGRPKLDRIIFRIIPDITTCFLELKQNGIQFLQDIVPEDIDPIS